MNDFNETNGSAAADLQSQLNHLRLLLFGTLLAGLIIGGSLNIYLLRQLVTARKDLTSVKQMVDNHRKHFQGFQSSIVPSLQDYGRKHSDYQAILQKYGIASGQGGGASSK